MTLSRLAIQVREMGIIVLEKGLGGPRIIFIIAVLVREVNFKRYHIMLGLTGP